MLRHRVAIDLPRRKEQRGPFRMSGVSGTVRAFTAEGAVQRFLDKPGIRALVARYDAGSLIARVRRVRKTRVVDLDDILVPL